MVNSYHIPHLLILVTGDDGNYSVIYFKEVKLGKFASTDVHFFLISKMNIKDVLLKVPLHNTIKLTSVKLSKRYIIVKSLENNSLQYPARKFY